MTLNKIYENIKNYVPQIIGTSTNSRIPRRILPSTGISAN